MNKDAYLRIIFVLIFTLATGCNAPATPEPTSTPFSSPTHPPTNTPIPTNTPLPTNTHPPTNTPVPTSTPVFPKGGANFNGTFDGGEITLMISSDGKTVTGIGYTIFATAKCAQGGTLQSLGGVDFFAITGVKGPITSNGFEVGLGILYVKGKFDSPTTASGTITVSLGEAGGQPPVGFTPLCKVGPANWTAQQE